MDFESKANTPSSTDNIEFTQQPTTLPSELGGVKGKGEGAKVSSPLPLTPSPLPSHHAAFLGWQTTTTRKPLRLLRDTEALLRRPTVATLLPILPAKLSNKFQATSSFADESFKELAEIDLDSISDFELRPVRIYVGLSFIGFGALMILVLLLYLNTLHPELSTGEQIRQYWYQYVWFVSLGVAGMFMLGREAMRRNL